MKENKGLPDDEFKKLCPELHNAISDSYKPENMYKADVYGMKMKFRKNTGDEMFFIKNIDDRTPVFAYKVATTMNGRDKFEMFFPN